MPSLELDMGLTGRFPTLRHHDPAYIRKYFAPFQQLEFEHLVYKTMNGHTANGFYFIGQK